MYKLDLGNNTILKQYKCVWYDKGGRFHYILKSMRVHAENLTQAKQKAISLFGSKPDNIYRI